MPSTPSNQTGIPTGSELAGSELAGSEPASSAPDIGQSPMNLPRQVTTVTSGAAPSAPGSAKGQEAALLRHRVARLNDSDRPRDSEQPDLSIDVDPAQVQKRLEDLALDQVLTAARALGTALRDVAYLPPSLIQPVVRTLRLTILEPVRDACLGLGDSEMRRVMAGPVRNAADLNELILDSTGEYLAGSSSRRLTDRLRLIEERALYKILTGHPDLDQHTTREVVTTTLRRIRWIEGRDPGEPSVDWCLRMHTRDQLDELTLSDAVSWDAGEDVLSALSLLSGIPTSITRVIMASGDARAVTALVWRAGLSMRFALLLQITAAAGITPAGRLNARDGTDFPMREPEMTRHLALYGAVLP